MKNTKNGFVIPLLVIILILVAGGIYYWQYSPLRNVNVPQTGIPQNVTSRGVLNLSGQGLTKVPDYVFNQTSIEEPNLSNNLLVGALQSQVGKLQNLKVLNLSNNRFTGVPAEVGQLTNLEILNLSNNQLTGLPNELGNLSKLKLLDLSGNKYSEADLLIIKNKLPASTVIKVSN